MGCLFEVVNFGDVMGIRMARTVLDRPLYVCLAYLIDDLLIDTGLAYVSQQFSDFTRKANVRQAVITHHHEDHSGNSSVLNRVLDIRPYAHPLAIPKIRDGFDMGYYQRVTWGVPRSALAQPIPEEVHTEKRTFKIISTPGHCEDLVVLLDVDGGRLFSGDLFIAKRLKYLRAEEDVHQLIDSLRKVLRYDFGAMYCAHRGEVKDGKRALSEKLDYLEGKREEVLYLWRQGKSEKEICRIAFGKEGVMTWITRGQFSKMNFVKSYLRNARNGQ